jgi:hypothetical protein
VKYVKSAAHSTSSAARKTYTIHLFLPSSRLDIGDGGGADREQVGEHSDELALHPSCT